MYKVIMKIFTNRLSLILPKIISDEQGALIKGKDITDSIALTSELTYELNRKVRGGNMNTVVVRDERNEYKHKIEEMAYMIRC